MVKRHLMLSNAARVKVGTRAQTVSTTQIELSQLIELGGTALERVVFDEAEKNPFLRARRKSASNHYRAGTQGHMEPVDGSTITFEKDVLEQIAACNFSTERAAIARVFFEHLDERGLLPDALKARIRGTARSVLDCLQVLDPPGVFACGLAECYEIQLMRQDSLTSEMRLFLAHLSTFESGGIDRLCAVAGISQSSAHNCLEQLKCLSPWPAYGRGSVSHGEYCIPEVALVYDGDDVRVLPELDWHLDVQVDESLHRRICRANGEVRCPAVDEAFSSATNLATAIEMRLATILKVAAVLATHQRAYLTGTEFAPKALTMKDVAAEAGIHESTVSRAARATYARTPIGVVELRALFPQKRVVNAHSCAFTNDEIHTKLIELVRSERTPRSDSELCTELRAFGINISRRTVAKYRTSLNIPPATQRSAGEVSA
ncbi:MAG: hypothetical protein RIE24_06325 [Silicimonas sp.]